MKEKMKYKKGICHKIFAFVLAFVMVVTLMPAQGLVVYASGEGTSNDPYLVDSDTDLRDKFQTATGTKENPTYIKLGSNINTTASLSVPSNKGITLDLNGFAIDRGLTEATNNGNVIQISQGAKLVINDSSASKSGKITGGYNLGVGGGITANVGSELIINGGSIYKNAAMGSGGGIYARENSTVTINGGKIIENWSAIAGGGVYCTHAEFAVENGQIDNNKAGTTNESGGDGGGISAHYSTVELKNSTVNNNECLASSGGGIYGYESLLKLTNVKVNENYSNGSGAGIDSSHCGIEMNETEISGNRVKDYGPAINVDDTNDNNDGFKLTNVTITNNKCSPALELSQNDASDFEAFIKDGTITNNAVSEGGFTFFIENVRLELQGNLNLADKESGKVTVGINCVESDTENPGVLDISELDTRLDLFMVYEYYVDDDPYPGEILYLGNNDKVSITAKNYLGGSSLAVLNKSTSLGEGRSVTFYPYTIGAEFEKQATGFDLVKTIVIGEDNQPQDFNGTKQWYSLSPGNSINLDNSDILGDIQTFQVEGMNVAAKMLDYDIEDKLWKIPEDFDYESVAEEYEEQGYQFLCGLIGAELEENDVLSFAYNQKISEEGFGLYVIGPSAMEMKIIESKEGFVEIGPVAEAGRYLLLVDDYWGEEAAPTDFIVHDVRVTNYKKDAANSNWVEECLAYGEILDALKEINKLFIYEEMFSEQKIGTNGSIANQTIRTNAIIPSTFRFIDGNKSEALPFVMTRTGEDYEIPLYKSDPLFLGWGTSPDGEALYSDGDTITADGFTTLYAIFKHGDWRYSVSGNKITAECGKSLCNTPQKKATLTLMAESKVYSGEPVTVSFGEGEAAAWKKAKLELPEIKYYRGSEELQEAPVEIGSYEARITVGETTVKAPFSITSQRNDFTGGGTATPTPEVTVPVSGEGTTNVTAKVEGGNATVSVDTTAINNAAGNTTQQDTDTITVDLSGLAQTVTSVTLSKADAANISNTLNSSANNKEYVEFQMKEYTVKVDSTAMAAVVNAAGGNDLKLVVETTAPAAALNDNQKAELVGKEVARTFEAYFVSNGTRISNFNGGSVQVGVVEFKVPAGNDARYYHVEYLPETGKAERYATRYMNGHLYFNTTHFSDYAIVYDESEENDSTILVHRLFNKVNGKHLLTTDANEIEHLLASGKWSEDEPVGRAASEGTAVYRLFNKVSGEHLYTADANEVKHNTAGKVWVADNNGDPIFYAPTSGKAVFRLFNIKLPGVACHINSADPDEIINLVDKGYVIENDGKPAFYLQ